MPFFFLGYFMRGKNIYLPNKYKPFGFLFLALTITIPLFFPQYLGNLTHTAHYGSIYSATRRMFVFGLATLMSIAFINTCPNKPWVARQGRFTMQYYIYHAMVITPLMIIASKLNITASFVSAIIYTAVMTIGIGIASRLPNFTKFTNPSSFLKN